VQPEDLEPERVALLLERLVLAAELEQARIEEHLAYGGKSFDSLHEARNGGKTLHNFEKKSFFQR
jgi:hypothetical protein